MADPIGYVNLDDIKAYGFQVDISKNEDLFNLLIPRASELFDILCGVEPGHFLVKNDPATERVVYGNGGPILSLPPHIGPVSGVVAPAGYSPLTFVDQGGYLKITNTIGEIQDLANAYLGISSMWFSGVPYKVTAKWGYDAVPESVKQATIEILIALWRSRDQAWTKAISLDTNQLFFNPAIPERAKVIANSFRSKRPASSAFV